MRCKEIEILRKWQKQFYLKNGGSGMTENISERIENAIKDIEKIQIMFQQKYGEECLADKEIEEVLKIAKAEHEKLEQYRSIGTVEECREAVERHKAKRPIDGKIRKVLGYYQCPTCEGLLTTNKRFCEDCGQRISFEESEEEDD